MISFSLHLVQVVIQIYSKVQNTIFSLRVEIVFSFVLVKSLIFIKLLISKQLLFSVVVSSMSQMYKVIHMHICLIYKSLSLMSKIAK